MNLLFFLLQIGEWVGMIPLPRAENRGLDPAMVLPQALTTLQCLFSMEKDTVSFNWAQGMGLQERADLKTAPLLFFIPSPLLGHRPSCGPSSLPHADIRHPLSAPPVLGDSHGSRPRCPGGDSEAHPAPQGQSSSWKPQPTRTSMEPLTRQHRGR